MDTQLQPCQQGPIATEHNRMRAIPMVDMRTCFAGLDSVICSWLALLPALRFSKKALIEVTCFGVR